MQQNVATAEPTDPVHLSSFNRGRLAAAAWEFGEGPWLSHYANADEHFTAGFHDYAEGQLLSDEEAAGLEAEIDAMLPPEGATTH